MSDEEQKRFQLLHEMMTKKLSRTIEQFSNRMGADQVAFNMMCATVGMFRASGMPVEIIIKHVKDMLMQALQAAMDIEKEQKEKGSLH